MTASVNSLVPAAPPTSLVMCFPSRWTCSRAASIRFAAELSGCGRLCGAWQGGLSFGMRAALFSACLGNVLCMRFEHLRCARPQQHRALRRALLRRRLGRGRKHNERDGDRREKRTEPGDIGEHACQYVHRRSRAKTGTPGATTARCGGSFRGEQHRARTDRVQITT